MAVEQSGAEASPDPAHHAGAAGQAPDAPSGPAQETTAGQPDSAKADLDELKRKFREALERKRGTHGSANAEGTQDTGKVHGSHGPASSRREFRRKSGG